jgi:hypothetical protein
MAMITADRPITTDEVMAALWPAGRGLGSGSGGADAGRL